MKLVFIFLTIALLSSCTSSPSLNEIELKNEPVSVSREKAELYYSIGTSLEENLMIEKAIENYQHAIKILPEHEESRFALGKLLLKRGFKQEGLKEVKKALEANPAYTEARNFLVRYYLLKTRNISAAKKLIDKSIEDLTYTNQEETWALKLKVDLRVGGKELAMKSALKTSTIPALNCENRLSISSSFYKMGLLALALNSARDADRLCAETENADRLSYLKGLIFIRKKNLFVAEKILNGISTEDKKLKPKLIKAQIFVRKKINSGL